MHVNAHRDRLVSTCWVCGQVKNYSWLKIDFILLKKYLIEKKISISPKFAKIVGLDSNVIENVKNQYKKK